MKATGRIDAIDAARGCAMVMVCLSHVRFHFDPDSALYELLTTVTRIATPTFLLLSGFVAAYLLRGDKSGRVGVILADRGLFLLLVAHLLLGLADLDRTTPTQWVFARVSIPDAIGVALCMAVLFRRVSVGGLMAIGVSLCLMSWIVALTWLPQSEWALAAGRVLFNLRGASNWLTDVALLPYLGTFLIGMAMSSHLHHALTVGEHPIIARRLITIGASTMLAAVALVVAWHFGSDSLPGTLREPHVADLLRHTIDPRIKWPPSPAYLLFYGGAGLLMAGIFFAGKPAAIVGPIVRITSTIGRASLMCFVLQDWLLFVVPKIFGFRDVISVTFWLAYVSFVLVALYVAALFWGSIRGNRFFTVGLRALYRRREERTHAAAAARSAASAEPRRYLPQSGR